MAVPKAVCQKPARWMETLHNELKDKTLLQITIPGTHDSGAFELLPRLIDNVADDLVDIADEMGLKVELLIEEWSLTQDFDIYGQLVHGMRYFDWRAVWDKKDSIWRTNHGQILGLPADQLVADVKRFMAQYKKEVVVIEVNNIMGSPTKKQKALLLDLFEEELGSVMCPRGTGTPEQGTADFKTIGEMVGKNQRLIVTFEEDKEIAKRKKFWYKNAIHNTYAGTPVTKKMIVYNDTRVKEFQEGKDTDYEATLYKMSWTLTPRLSTITLQDIKGVGTLLDLAERVNPKLRHWWESVKTHGHEYPILGNILIVDHFSTADVLRCALETSESPQVADPLPPRPKLGGVCPCLVSDTVAPAVREPHERASSTTQKKAIQKANAEVRRGEYGLEEGEFSWVDSATTDDDDEDSESDESLSESDS